MMHGFQQIVTQAERRYNFVVHGLPPLRDEMAISPLIWRKRLMDSISSNLGYYLLAVRLSSPLETCASALEEHIEGYSGSKQYHSGGKSNAPVAEKLHEDHISNDVQTESPKAHHGWGHGIVGSIKATIKEMRRTVERKARQISAYCLRGEQGICRAEVTVFV